MSTPPPAATSASAPVPTYDPVALAESLASAAEKSAKLMGEFAARNAGKHAVVAATSSVSARRSWSSRRKC